MASGMNGQHFTFNGYLPIQTGEREKMIKTLEKKAVNENCTQLFIETPYRNNQMLQSLQQVLHDNTKLCIAYHLTSLDEWVMTKKISEWKKNSISLPKEPAIFIIGS
jgi:16S rRNA (cytidine1402-2'-O)-methyltransferase